MARQRSEVATRAGRAPSSRRRELLEVAARLFAERGYGGTSIDDLGAAAGVSGPALYWHFPSKDALLAELLTDVSERLLVGAGRCVEEAPDAASALRGLVELQATFAVQEPALITVHHRDLPHLADPDRKVVRRTQRRYLAIWVDVLARLHPERDPEELLLATHAVFGLLNATPNMATADPRRMHALLVELALGALAPLGRRAVPPATVGPAAATTVSGA